MDAADSKAVLPADRAGENGEVPVSGDHFLHGIRREDLGVGDGIGEDAAVQVGKGDGGARGDAGQGAELGGVVVAEDDEVVRVG